MRVHRLSRFLFVSDKAEAERRKKSLAFVKQVLHFNKGSQFVLFDYVCFMHSEVSIIVVVVCGLSALALCFLC